MERVNLGGAIAAIVVGACLASGVQAQSKPVEPWQPSQGVQDPAKRVPDVATGQEGGTVAAQPQADAARAYEEDRGGAFIGVSAGKGWIFDDVDQSARQLTAGYRWQAGPVSLLGVEVSAGKLSAKTQDDWRYDPVDFAGIGFSGRFNFGRHSPVFALVRAGYWAADASVNDGAQRADVDGGYVGLGLGADIGRHFSLSLTYTNYVYFNELYWQDGDLYYDANRADTLLFGGEVRF